MWDAQLKEESNVELPFWVVKDLAARGFVGITRPKYYDHRVRNDLEADSRCVNLIEKCAYYYEMGLNVLSMCAPPAKCLPQRPHALPAPRSLPRGQSPPGWHGVGLRVTDGVVRVLQHERQVPVQDAQDDVRAAVRAFAHQGDERTAGHGRPLTYGARAVARGAQRCVGGPAPSSSRVVRFVPAGGVPTGVVVVGSTAVVG